jgi:CubicO group peptidase (beta-lactamase class C family)
MKFYRYLVFLVVSLQTCFPLEVKHANLKKSKESGSLPTCMVKSVAEIKNNVPNLKVLMDKLISTGQASSLSIAITAKGEIVYAQGFGKNVTNETLFQAGSLSKPVTAFAFLKLAEAGVFNLGHPLSKSTHLPYFDTESQGNLISARHVLSHTSGMGSDIMGNNRALSFTPGARFSYSGAGFRFLQQAMEDKTKKPFSTLIRPFLDDLGMRTSTFEMPFQDKTFVNAAASLLSTPTELSFLLNQLVKPKKENRNVAELMFKPQIKVNDKLSWGLGVGQYRCNDDTVLWHWGSNFETNFTLAVMYKNSQTGVVIMSSGRSSQELLRELVVVAIGGNNYQFWKEVPKSK